MEPEQYELLRRCEEDHWFYRGQWAIAAALLARHLPANADARILDTGCGTGGTSRRLSRFGSVIGLDSSTLAVSPAHAGGLRCVRGSVSAMPFRDGSFDVVTCFDVLYHQQVADDLHALREFHRVLRPRGLLLLRVPAFERLRRTHDAAVHTRHRYRASEIDAKLSAAHYRVRVVTYANTLLFPFIVARILWDRIRGASADMQRSDLSPPPPVLNRLLTFLLSLEAHVVTRVRLPVGLSIVALAERA